MARERHIVRIAESYDIRPDAFRNFLDGRGATWKRLRKQFPLK
jgi:hypothetical protein